MTWFKLAFRNVFRQKKRSFLLASAIAFGMLSITLLNALTGAMATAVKTNFSTAIGGHVYITGEVISPRGYSTSLIDQTAILDQVIKNLPVPIMQVKPRSNAQVQLVNGSAVTRTSISGIKLENEPTLFTKLRVMQGDMRALQQPGNIAIPLNRAKDLNVRLGDKVLVKGATNTGQQNLLEWTIVALFADQSSFGRSNSYASIVTVNNLLNIPADQYQQVNLVLQDLNHMATATAELNLALTREASIKPQDDDGLVGPMRRMMGSNRTLVENPWQGTQFEVTNLDDVTENVMAIVRGLDWVAKLIFVIMLVITLVGISNSYRMVLLERVAEIGNMRAMGAQANNVFRLFIYEAVILGMIGIALGLILALAGVATIESLNFADSRGPARMFTVAGHLPLMINMGSVLVSSALIMVMAMLAAYFPARGAARLDPAEALRSAT